MEQPMLNQQTQYYTSDQSDFILCVVNIYKSHLLFVMLPPLEQLTLIPAEAFNDLPLKHIVQISGSLN